MFNAITETSADAEEEFEVLIEVTIVWKYSDDDERVDEVYPPEDMFKKEDEIWMHGLSRNSHKPGILCEES